MRLVRIPGLRCFLLALLNLIDSEKEISVSEIDILLKTGIATNLSDRYRDSFESFGLDESNYEAIDTYYKKYIGCTVDCERKYGVDENHGLSLLIAFSLNEF